MPNREIEISTFQELRQMSGADFIGELVDTFLDDTPKLMKELRSALQAKDADSFRRAAHSLKSNAATFGAKHLSELARELEQIGKDGKLADVGDRLANLEQTYQSAATELKGLRA